MKAINKLKNKKFLLPVIALLIIVAAAVGYAIYSSSRSAAAATTAVSTMKTTRARLGNLSVSASGSGTLVASRETALSFSTSGVVASLNVLAGDQVEEGQVLAELNNLDSLKTNVKAAELAVTSAQLSLETLKENAPAALANAQLTLATAKKAVIDSKSHLVKEGMIRCDQEMTDAYYERYLVAQRELDALGDGGGSTEYYLHYIVPAKNTVAQDYSTYIYCAGYTVYEIDATQANLSLAEADLKTAQATLDSLQKNNGLDPNAQAVAQNTVANAELDLDAAKETLAGGTLVAPFAGTILSVAGLAGDQVDTTTFITMADLTRPQVKFSIDETDMDKAEAGKEAQVIFDALPNRTFTGTILRIFPSLVASNGSQVIQGLIQLDLSKETDLPTLPAGLNASVEILSGNAKNAVLVPVQAVRDIGDGEFGVFVLNKGGQPRLIPVKVGLMDTVSAEILEGVSAGDTVTTGITEVK